MRISAVAAVSVGNDKEGDTVTGTHIEEFAGLTCDQITAAALQRGVRPDELDILDRAVFGDLVVAERVAVAGGFALENHGNRIVVGDLDRRYLHEARTARAVQNVVAVVAVERIVSGSTPDFIIAVLAGEEIVAETSGHYVGVFRAIQNIIFIGPDDGTCCG